MIEHRLYVSVLVYLFPSLLLYMMTEPYVIRLDDSSSDSSILDSYTVPSPIIRSPPTIIKQSRFSVNAVLGIHGSFSDSDTSSSHSQPDVDNLDSVEASDVFSPTRHPFHLPLPPPFLPQTVQLFCPLVRWILSHYLHHNPILI